MRWTSKSARRGGGNDAPILVDGNKRIVAGHGRHEAAKLLKLATAPVIRLAHQDRSADSYKRPPQLTAPASNLPPHLNFGRPVELIPLDQLRPWSRNARTHSQKQIGQIAQSIRRFGFTNPVLIDGENRILAGHGRVEAARTLGMAAAPCLRFDHLSIQEKRAYVLADNKLALNAGWDEELLALELKELMAGRYRLWSSTSPASRSPRSTS